LEEVSAAPADRPEQDRVEVGAAPEELAFRAALAEQVAPAAMVGKSSHV